MVTLDPGRIKEQLTSIQLRYRQVVATSQVLKRAAGNRLRPSGFDG